MREVAVNMLLIFISGAILYHFYLIITEGSVTIYETSTPILSLEVVMFCAFIAFAIFNVIKRLRGR